MNETMQQVVPVAISILVIILIAIVQTYSKTLAAITATMPLTVPLALWIIYAAEDGDRAEVLKFTEGLFEGIFATFVFVVVLWIAAKLGLSLVLMLLVSYAAWAGVLILGSLLRGAGL